MLEFGFVFVRHSLALSRERERESKRWSATHQALDDAQILVTCNYSPGRQWRRANGDAGEVAN